MWLNIAFNMKNVAVLGSLYIYMQKNAFNFCFGIECWSLLFSPFLWRTWHLMFSTFCMLWQYSVLVLLEIKKLTRLLISRCLPVLLFFFKLVYLNVIFVMDYLTTYWCSLSKVLVRCFFRFVFVLVSLLHSSSYNASKQWSYISFCHGTKCIFSASTNKVSGWNYSEQTKSSLHVNMSVCCLCVNCLVCKNDTAVFAIFCQDGKVCGAQHQHNWLKQILTSGQYNMQILGTDAFVSATDKQLWYTDDGNNEKV